MPKTRTRDNASESLLTRAEKRLRADESKSHDPLSPGQAQQVLHDLQVHQIELEMQNEELRRTQVELEASRERYFDLYDLAPVGYLTLNEKGLIAEVNLTATKLLGVERRALLQQPLARFIFSEDQGIYYKYRKALLAIGLPQACELRLAKKDCALFWVHLEATVAQGADGPPVCRMVMSDITERKQAESMLRKSEQRYHSLFENMMEGVASCRMLFEDNQPRDCVYLAVNKAFERLTGLTDVVGKTLMGLIPDVRESHPELLEIYGRVALTGQPERFENYFERLGAWLTVSVYGTEKGCFVAVFENITERKNAEAVLRRANRTMLMLKECDEALMRAKSEDDLLNAICRIIVETGGALMAWVGFAENDAAKTVRPVAQAGCDEEFLERIQVTWADVPRGQCSMGTAIRNCKVDQCLNLAVNSRSAPWRQIAIQLGHNSAIALPLIWDSHCLGALAIASSKAEGFNQEEVELLERLAADLTFGIIALRTRAEREQLQGEILEISEREKELISQELHDGLCQNLAGTAFLSNALYSRLAAKKDRDGNAAKEICDLLNVSVDETRHLSHGLHPVGPGGEGLMNALSQLAGTVRNLFHIHCTFRCPEPVIIDNGMVSTHLFRITQEALNNARKHGEADRVTISLRNTLGGLVLKIRDNGIGIPVVLPTKPGMGLRIMNHRATEIGATLSVRRAIKGGTVVSCTLPCG